MKSYQSEDITLDDVINTEETKQLLINCGKLLTKMVNCCLGNEPGENTPPQVEIEFFVVLDKTNNPRGEKGFFDVRIKGRSSQSGTMEQPEIVTVKQRLETRQVVVWE